MTYAVELFLETSGETAIRELWQVLADARLSTSMIDVPVHPHITLGGCDKLDTVAYESALRGFAERTGPFDLELAQLGMFPQAGALFLGPVVSRTLIEVHHDFYRRFAWYAVKPWKYYMREHWVPHATLADNMSPADLPRAVEVVMAHITLPLYVRIERVMMVDIDTADILYEYPLKGETRIENPVVNDE